MNIAEIRKNNILSKFNIDINDIKNKFVCIDLYSSKKIELCYERLSKPKINYYITLNNNDIKQINKTIYLSLSSILEDTKQNKQQFSKLCNDNLYNRFKDKDYKHINYLSPKEKELIFITECFYKGYYENIINTLF